MLPSIRRSLVFTLLSLLLVHVAGMPAPATDVTADIGGLSIGDIINALGIGLVQNISALITLESLTTNLIEQVSRHILIACSPLTLKYQYRLHRVSSLAGINNTVYASFDHTFDPPVVVRPLGTADSGTIDNVLLVQGAINSLNIIPLEELDLLDVNVSVRAASIDGFGGIPIPIDGLKQSDVPTTYNLDLTN
ncbi:hypothetical protein LENED_006996 [Lentinula edodes]|uniref:Uncharacterized protein n=1 Tax=Lentinula edodes TaxID=5353 RepID=A0A1Q3ED77_LENED|nr:hypothetical protein LENED_006996 [Lentinula edodes]